PGPLLPPRFLVEKPGWPKDIFHGMVQDLRHRGGNLSMWKSLGTVRKYLWRYRWGMALGMFCLILKDLAQAGQPLMIRGAIDSLSKPGALFVRFALYLVGLALVKGLFQFWMRVIIIGVSRDIEY